LARKIIGIKRGEYEGVLQRGLRTRPMQKELKIFKGRSILECKFLERLYLAWRNIPNNSRKGYLPYQEFRTQIPRSFQITKQEALSILKTFENDGSVSFCKRGIKINFEVPKNG
jgi:hypothetical protein